MKKRNKRLLLALVLFFVFAGVWFVLFSQLPYTAATPATAWQKFIEWHITALAFIKEYIVMLLALVVLLIGGAYLSLKK